MEAMLLPILNKSIFLTMVLLTKSDELANYLKIVGGKVDYKKR